MPHKDKNQKNAYFRAYYRAHKRVINGRVSEINKRRRHERYALVKETKEASSCMDCGHKFPYFVMDFDHRDPTTKVTDVSILVKNGTRWALVLEEIAKCDLVCVNCHRLRTYKGQSCYRTRRYEHHRNILDQLKTSTPCLDCGKTYQPCQMDLDHLKSKSANVSKLMSQATEVLLKELAKCHLVCANCHRVRSNTGKRREASSHSADLVRKFQEIASRVDYPEDQRFVPFPFPQLLGVLPDKELAMKTGISREMVAWYRRKAGITSSRRAA